MPETKVRPEEKKPYDGGGSHTIPPPYVPTMGEINNLVNQWGASSPASASLPSRIQLSVPTATGLWVNRMRKKTTGWRVGCVVANHTATGLRIAWSLCNRTAKDRFNADDGVALALGRTLMGREWAPIIPGRTTRADLLEAGVPHTVIPEVIALAAELYGQGATEGIMVQCGKRKQSSRRPERPVLVQPPRTHQAGTD